jgi:hypothetical protein
VINQDERPFQSGRQSRLQEVDDRPRFAPWQRAWNLDACELYWIPASGFPLGYLEWQWLLSFQQRLQAKLAEKHGLKPEFFLQLKVIQPNYRDPFIKNSRSFQPIFGLGRYPKRPLPAIPDEKWAEDLSKGRIQYDHKALQPDYSYWFLEKKTDEQRRLFFGSGGTTTLFLKPGDPPQKVDPIRSDHIRDPELRKLVEGADINAKLEKLQSLKSPFLAQSKELFAADLQEDPQYPGLLFCLPLFSASHFFEATADEIGEWFNLFGVYLRESPEDHGLLLASSVPLEDDLDEILDAMRADGMEYPS